MTTSTASANASTSTTSQPAAPLTDTERTRLLRKDALDHGMQMSQKLGADLHAWLNVALGIERNQVQGDRIGAMYAVAQQQQQQTPLPPVPTQAPPKSTPPPPPIAATPPPPSRQPSMTNVLKPPPVVAPKIEQIEYPDDIDI